MTNPDNVGGRPPLPNAADLSPTCEFLYTADQMRAYAELCRAAPAGAETGNPVSEQNQLDSAPAGSGEVDALCQWFWDNAMVTGDVTGSPDDYREHAIKLLAFLRKLQQGAE